MRAWLSTERAGGSLRAFVVRTWWVVALLGVVAAITEDDGEEHLAQPASVEQAVDIAGTLGPPDEVTPVLAFAAPCAVECAGVGSSAVWLAAADGSAPVQLTRPVGASDRLPRWSPDGTALAFVRGNDAAGAGDLMVMRLDGSALQAPVRLSDTRAIHGGQGCDADLLEPVWSPDSQMVATTCARDDASAILVHSAGSPTVFEVPRTGSAADMQPTWSPDGSRLAFTRRNLEVAYADPERLTIWTAAIGRTGAADVRRLIGGDVAVAAPSWSPDGQRLAFVERNERMLETVIATLELRGGTVNRHWMRTGHDPVQPYEIVWTPDGTALAFPAGDGLTLSTITILGLSGTDEVAVPSSAPLAFSPRWSADGTSLLFEEIDGDRVRLRIYDVDSGLLSEIEGVPSGSDGSWGLVRAPSLPPVGEDLDGDEEGPVTAPSLTVPPPTLPPPPTVTLPTIPEVTLPTIPGVTAPTIPDVTVPTIPGVTVPTIPGVSTTLPPVDPRPSVPTTLPGTPTVPTTLPPVSVTTPTTLPVPTLP